MRRAAFLTVFFFASTISVTWAQVPQAPAEIARPTALSSTVTVQLPPARPVETVKALPVKATKIVLAAPSITVPLPPLKRATERPAPPPAPAAVQTARAAAPRLERLSMAEVALVTTGKPVWQAPLASAMRPNIMPRWVPIQNAAASSGIKILNAARYARLAATARTVLVGRGWRGITIGDAPQVRKASMIWYPADRGVLGRRLAAQFGIRTLIARESGGIVVLLGRDAAALKATPRRG
jgi:hypothetical protein